MAAENAEDASDEFIYYGAKPRFVCSLGGDDYEMLESSNHQSLQCSDSTGTFEGLVNSSTECIIETDSSGYNNASNPSTKLS
jgi:hypothetical protein